MALLFLPRSARAHTPGLALADFDVQADGQVEARLTFASAEPLAGLALDRDGDGVVTADDVAGARDDLRAFVLQGVGVDADGSPCRPAFGDASLTEVDALVLRASYACPSDATNIDVTLYYLSARPRGSAPLKAIARIAAGSATAEALLTGEHRAIALRLPGKARAAWRMPARVAGLAVAAGVIGLFVYASRRRLAGRAMWRRRAP
jgi:hypothetical protein